MNTTAGVATGTSSASASAAMPGSTSIAGTGAGVNQNNHSKHHHHSVSAYHTSYRSTSQSLQSSPITTPTSGTHHHTHTHHSHAHLHAHPHNFSKVSSSPSLFSSPPIANPLSTKHPQIPSRLGSYSRESSPTGLRHADNDKEIFPSEPNSSNNAPDSMMATSVSNPAAGSPSASTSSTATHRTSISSASPLVGNSSLSASSHFKHQYDLANEANRVLETRIEVLERENRDLKRSVYELSYLYSQCVHQMKHVGILPPPFDYTLLSTNLISSSNIASNSWLENGSLVTQSSSVATAHDKHKRVLESATNHLRPLSSSAQLSQTTQNEKQPLQLRPFIRRLDFLGHTSAIYAIAFSRNGKYVATGSMDKSLKIWDIESHLTSTSLPPTQHQQPANSSRRELLSLSEHTMTISDVTWNEDSSMLISASFDKTVRLWDVYSGSLASTFEMPGFPQSVRYEPQTACIYVGSTSKKISCIDLRSKSVVRTFENDSMVSSVEIADETYLWSGDHNGAIRVWDVRTGLCVYRMANGTAAKPISHLHIGRNHNSQTSFPSISSIHSSPSSSSSIQSELYAKEYLLAVNSFDDVLRVYSGGYQSNNTRNVSHNESKSSSANSVADNSPLFALHLRHELRGHKNQNWPIRSSFYIGDEYDGAEEWRVLNEYSFSSSSSSSPSSSPISSMDEDDESGDTPPVDHQSRIIQLDDNLNPKLQKSYDETRNAAISPPPHSLLQSHHRRHARSMNRFKRPSLALPGISPHSSTPFSINQTALLATGSADSYAYIFDVGGPNGEGKLLQRLEGHRDRVYVCVFHPTEPIIVTGSADSTAKVWTAKAG